jgi:hypothetical protein
MDGPLFGTYPDATSQLIYRDAWPALLSGVPRTDSVLDLGGANGLSRLYFENVTTVDSDPTSGADVVADIRTYEPEQVFDRVLLRYVLHYLPDIQVLPLLRRIASYHDGPVHVIQFVGRTEEKAASSADRAVRWFRTEASLRSLMAAGGYVVDRRIALQYTVEPEFYLNRLGQAAPAHEETTVSLTLQKARRADRWDS